MEVDVCRWKLSWKQMKLLNEATSMFTAIEKNGSTVHQLPSKLVEASTEVEWLPWKVEVTKEVDGNFHGSRLQKAKSVEDRFSMTFLFAFFPPVDTFYFCLFFNTIFSPRWFFLCLRSLFFLYSSQSFEPRLLPFSFCDFYGLLLYFVFFLSSLVSCRVYFSFFFCFLVWVFRRLLSGFCWVVWVWSFFFLFLFPVDSFFFSFFWNTLFSPRGFFPLFPFFLFLYSCQWLESRPLRSISFRLFLRGLYIVCTFSFFLFFFW